MDDELAVLLIEAHRNIGFLEGFEYHRYNEDTSLVKMLHGRMEKENLFIEVEYTSVKKQNPLVESLFSGYKDIPVSYQSVANQLPSVFAIHFKALDSNLPERAGKNMKMVVTQNMFTQNLNMIVSMNRIGIVIR